MESRYFHTFEGLKRAGNGFTVHGTGVPGGGQAGSENFPTPQNGNIEIPMKGMSKYELRANSDFVRH